MRISWIISWHKILFLWYLNKSMEQSKNIHPIISMWNGLVFYLKIVPLTLSTTIVTAEEEYWNDFELNKSYSMRVQADFVLYTLTCHICVSSKLQFKVKASWFFRQYRFEVDDVAFARDYQFAVILSISTSIQASFLSCC